MKHLFIVAIVTSQTLLAFQFGEPTYNGPGCPPGSNSFVLSPDNTSLSILTGQFALNENNATVWTHCELIVPISVASTETVKVDLRGFHSLPENALHGTLVTHWPIGGPGQANSQNYFRTGSETDNFFHSHLFNISFASQTALKLIISTMISNPSTTESVSLSLDSIDLTIEKATFAPIMPCNSAMGLQFGIVIAVITGIASLL